MNKKILAVFFAAVLGGSLAACGCGGSAESSGSASGGAAANPDITRGMNYDVGILFGSAPVSDTHPTDGQMTAEFDIIRDDLHCDALRVSGTDVDTMVRATELALQAGLDVWLSPHYIDKPQEEMREKVRECAEKAQALQDQYPDNEIVLLYGCEMVYFAEGFADGSNFTARMSYYFDNMEEVCGRLNEYFAEEIPEIRKIFNGRISYCATDYEDIDWDLFDIISLDYYRSASNKDKYADLLDRFLALGKPVAITEVGYCCYTGGGDAGGGGYMIRDTGNPSKLNDLYERNEAEQAEALVESLDALYTKDLEAVFVFTFKQSSMAYNEDPMYDLDMAGYGIVKCYRFEEGTTYEGMPWDPKEAFHAVAKFNEKAE